MSRADRESATQSILNVPFDWINCEETAARIEQWRKLGQRNYACLVNPHSIMLARRDKRTLEAFQGASLVLPDGAGTILAANLLGYAHRGRVAGPTLMLELCDRGRAFGWRHYFYGGAAGVASTLAERLDGRFPGMTTAGVYSPPFGELSVEERRATIEHINAARPDIVWVGLGAPKQERWMAEHIGQVEAAALVGVGAAFDFHAGEVPWAPSWIRRIGCEWAFRFWQEPRRMWRRNIDSPHFLALVARQRLTRGREMAGG